MARDDTFSWKKRHKDPHVAHMMHEKELKSFYGKVSRELKAKCPSGAAGMEVLSAVLSQLRRSEIPLRESPFLNVLAESDAAYSSALCAAIVARPTSSLAGAFHVFLNAIEAFRPWAAMKHAGKAVRTGEASLCFSVVNHLDWIARTRGLTNTELVILQALFEHKDKAVVSHALGVIKWVGAKAPEAGVQLLLAAGWEADNQLASAALSCIDAQHGIPPKKIRDRELKLLLGRLENTPDIGDWQVSKFISYASGRCPLAVGNLLINRIKRLNTLPQRPQHVLVEEKSH